MQKINDLYEWISLLKCSGKLVVVEGKKDVRALSKLGINNVRPLKSPLFNEVEEIAEIADEVVLLLDLDKEGKKRSGAFFVHVHGPWGSGKTTLLNLLRNYLRNGHERPLGEKYNKSPWIVIDFNAWQQQRMRPPWWSLMDAVFRGAVRQLNSKRKEKNKGGKQVKKYHISFRMIKNITASVI